MIKHTPNPLYYFLTTATIFGMITAADAAGPDAGALQNQLQKQMDNEQLQARPEAETKKSPEIEAPSGDVEAIEVKDFEVSGNTLITSLEIQSVLAPYKNRTLSFDQINRAALEIDQLYKRKGYLAHAVIPQQDIENGIIRIKVLEGKVGHIKIEQEEGAPPLRINQSLIEGFASYKNASNDFLNLERLDRSLVLMNELPGVSVESTLETGEVDQATNIRLKVAEGSLLSGFAELSNYGSASTGYAQVVGNLSLNSPLGLGDQLSLNFNASEGSTYGQLKYSQPVGYDGLKLGANLALLDYKTLGSFSSTISQGNSQVLGIDLTYPLQRTQTNQLNLVSAYTSKHYANESAGTPTSNYHINEVSLGANGHLILEASQMSWGVTGLLGYLSMASDTQISQDTHPDTRGTFLKLSFNGGYTKPIFEKTTVQLSVSGQLANKNLNSAEQLYLGGPYGVRAYPIAQGGGAEGLILSGEVVQQLAEKLQVSAFADVGSIKQYVNTWADWQGNTHADNFYSIYALGVASRYSFKRFDIQGTMAWRVGENPLYNANGQQLNLDNHYHDVQGWVKLVSYF